MDRPYANSKPELEERLRQFEAYNRWEADHPIEPRPAADLIADVGLLADWLTPQTRLEDPNPKKEGVRRMQDILSVVKCQGSNPQS